MTTTPDPCTTPDCPRLALTDTNHCARHTPPPNNPPPQPDYAPGGIVDGRLPRTDVSAAEIRVPPSNPSQGAQARIRLNHNNEVISVHPDHIRLPDQPLPLYALAAIRKARVDVTIPTGPNDTPTTGRIIWAPLPARKRRQLDHDQEPDQT